MRPTVYNYPDEITNAGEVPPQERLRRQIMAKSEEVETLELEYLGASGPEIEEKKMRHLLANKDLLLLRAKLDFAKRHNL